MSSFEHVLIRSGFPFIHVEHLTRADLSVPYACGFMDTFWYSDTLKCHISGVSGFNLLKLDM